MKLHKIEAGTFLVDGGAMFGVVPKRVWEKRYPCNEENFCTLTMRCLVVKTDDRLILIDTGTGDKQLEYLKYYHFSGIVDFVNELQKLGYSTNEVTDVVLTHLHFDHCGTCTRYSDEEKTQIELTFPNATHWVTKSQWENFIYPNVREGNSYFPENMLPVEAAGKLKLIEEEQFLCPEVELRIFNGHTVGQIAPYIQYKDKTIIYVGDVIPIQAAIPISWVSSYDTFPISSMEEKERMLKEASEKNQILFFEHDAYYECCTVHSVNGRYKLNESFKLENIL